ncbi:MAG TPA: TonB-dependent receptor [Thermoanaerobaculia bacterium]|jgi:outer membrane receptor protein involved in Fe transport
MSVCALLFLFSFTAEEPPAQTKVEETVVVTATRSERGVSDLPVSTTVITEEEIEAAPAHSVDDLIRTIPGVQSSVISGSGSTPNNQRISMHGLGGTRALVLLDGVPLHDPYSGIVQWQKVPLDTLRQVEVVRGGNASLFGNFALGGTINLITRPVEENAVRADFSYGSGATSRSSLSVDQLVTEKLAARLSYNRNDAEGFVRVPDPGPIDEAAWIDIWITSGRADYRISDRSNAFLKSSLSQIDISQGTPGTYSKRDIFETSAGAHRALGSKSLLAARAFYQRQSERLVNSTILGARVGEFVSQDATTPANVAGGSLEWSAQRSGVIPFVSFGVDLQQMSASESRMTFNRSGAITQRNLVEGRQRFIGVYAQASWQPSPRLEVLTSARLDTFRNYDGSNAIIGGTTTLYPARSSKQLDPRISIRYALGAHSALRGSAYRAFNAPTLRDLYRNNQTGNSVVLGNPNLEPETLVGGEVGYELALDRGRFELNLFRSTIDGLQSRANVPGQPATVFQYLNLGTARSEGVELISNYRVTRKWSVDAGYTFADSTIIEDPNPELVGKMTPEVPRHAGTLGLRFRGDRGTTADVRGRVVSRSYGEAQNLSLSPAHRVVDISASQELRPWLDVYGMVENGFNEEYWLALAPTSFRSGLPRTVTVGVRVRAAR